MPPSSKRPNVFHWIGFLLLVAAALGAIGTIFASLIPSFQSNALQYSGSAAMGIAKAPAVESMDFAIAPDMGFAPSPMPPETRGGATPVDAEGKSIEPRIIKNGSLSLRVVDAVTALDEIKTIVSGKNGLVESSNISDPGEGPRTAWITVRVPVERFDEAMRDLKRAAVLVLNESVNAQDITAEFVDLEADLRNARAEEQSYLDILKRSGTIEEVLAVTQQLANVRGRIERLEGRKRYLENRTDLATISITLTEETRVDVPSRTWRPLEVVRQALRDLVESLQTFVDILIRLVVAVVGLVLPIAAVTALFAWLIWKLIRLFLHRN